MDLKRFNNACRDELCKINNIGQTLADRIIEYRQTHGPITRFKDLENIFHIGRTRRKAIAKYFSATGYDGEVYRENLRSRKIPSNKLFILHVNIRDLHTYIHKIKNLIDPFPRKPDVICVSDSTNPTDEEASLDEYTFKCIPDSENLGCPGGVAIYVNKSFENQLDWRDDLIFEIPGCENIWLNITWKGKSYVIGAIYRHPKTESSYKNDFNQSLKETIEKLKRKDEVFYILGDFNLNLLDDHDEFIKDYRDMLKKLGAGNLIHTATRVEASEIGSSSMLLDHITTNDHETPGKISGVIKTDCISDHYPVYVIIKQMPGQNIVQRVIGRLGCASSPSRE